MSSEFSQPTPDSEGILPMPERLPVMTLPGCTLLPQNILPLCIFEQKFRLMLKEALDSDRMFCIGMRKGAEESPAPPDGQPDDIHPHMTIGIIRACVTNRDGTSNLLLQGIKRVRLVSWHQVQPFRIADIEAAPSTGLDHPDLPTLKETLINLIDELQQQGVDISSELIQTLSQADDASVMVDIAGFHLIRCSDLQQELLATDSVPKRLGRLIELLRRVRNSGQTSDD